MAPEIGVDVGDVLVLELAPIIGAGQLVLGGKSGLPLGLGHGNGAQVLGIAFLGMTGAAIFAVEVLALAGVALAAGGQGQAQAARQEDHGQHDGEDALIHDRFSLNLRRERVPRPLYNLWFTVVLARLAGPACCSFTATGVPECANYLFAL